MDSPNSKTSYDTNSETNLETKNVNLQSGGSFGQTLIAFYPVHFAVHHILERVGPRGRPVV